MQTIFACQSIIVFPKISDVNNPYNTISMKRLLIVLHIMIGLLLPATGFCVPSLEEIAQWRNEASQGDVFAQFNIGVMYRDGDGVQQDYTEAMKWFKLAAAQGNAKVQFIIGAIYVMGQGVTQDFRIAKEWFRKVCDNGDQQSCYWYRILNEAGY